jgi:hypothetical protein
MLPWFGVLCLLALPRNRAAGAWWILAPLGLVTLAVSLCRSSEQEPLVYLADGLYALTFGAAGFWLLEPYVRSRFYPLRLASVFLIIIPTALVVWTVRFQGDWGPEWFAFGMALGLVALITCAAFVGALLVCRRQYQPGRLLAGFAAIALLAGLIIYGFAAFVAVLGGAEISMLWVVLAMGVGMAALCAASLFPLLVLSFYNGFYRERLRHLLGCSATASGVALTPPLAASLAKTM